MSRVRKQFLFVFHVLLAASLVLAAALALVNLFGDWAWLFPGHVKKFYFQTDFKHLQSVGVAILFAAIAVCVLIRLVTKLSLKSEKSREGIVFWGLMLLVIAAAAMPRIVLFSLFASEIAPYSDFSMSWERAIGATSSLGYHQFFPAYVNWSLLEKAVVSFFGPSYPVILLFCMICQTVTAVCLLLIGRFLFKDVVTGTLAALLFALSPSTIAYGMTSTPEHLTIACMAIAVFLVLRSLEVQSQWRRLGLVALAGFVGGIGNSVKSIFVIVVIAYAIVLLMIWLRNPKETSRAALAGSMAASLVILFAVQLAVTGAVTSASERVFATELAFSDANPHFLNVGLNRQGEGQIHLGKLSRGYLSDRLRGVSRAEAAKTAKSRVIADWRPNLREIPSFFFKKMIWAWQDDYIPIHYFLHTSKIRIDKTRHPSAYRFIEQYGSTASQLWYLAIILLGQTGAVCSLMRIKEDRQKESLLLCNLIIMGYFCITVLSESQSRYKCLAMPWLCLLAAWGAMTVFSLIRHRSETGRWAGGKTGRALEIVEEVVQTVGPVAYPVMAVPGNAWQIIDQKRFKKNVENVLAEHGGRIELLEERYNLRADQKRWIQESLITAGFEEDERKIELFKRLLKNYLEKSLLEGGNDADFKFKTFVSITRDIAKYSFEHFLFLRQYLERASGENKTDRNTEDFWQEYENERKMINEGRYVDRAIQELIGQGLIKEKVGILTSHQILDITDLGEEYIRWVGDS